MDALFDLCFSTYSYTYVICTELIKSLLFDRAQWIVLLVNGTTVTLTYNTVTNNCIFFIKEGFY